MKKTTIKLAILCALLGLSVPASAQLIERTVPKTLPSHPGNIFLVGETVNIPAPPGEVQTWRMHDYDDKMIAKGDIKDGRIELGKLPVGYYKIVRGAPGQYTNRTWIGVLEPLRVPTPLTSPIGIDVALAWFIFDKAKMQEVASICQLAGINRVRDRLLWGEIEPKRGEFVPQTRYDTTAKVQAGAGLQILQVCHVSAEWANPHVQHFPPDLRDIHNFYREMAQRWKGEVGAFEPWNEAEIVEFGGHTGSEMATFQKASYLGLKAGNPDVVACENVFAIRRPETLQDFAANKATAYFDTYNLHHYEQLSNYPSLYADHRANSGGKPMWVTECSVHVKWSGEEQYKELSEATVRLQSERVTKTYAMSLHEGVQAIFYFILGHYSEHNLQYGLLHPDLSPRPGYLALAAVGRLLADAKPLGMIKTPDKSVNGYLYNSKQDGKESKVLVIWSTNETTFEMPKTPDACFDHLGRAKAINGKKLSIGNAPVYAVFSNETEFNLIAPPRKLKLVDAKPGNIVLQALPPESAIDFKKSAYKIAIGKANEIPIYLYNFGTNTLRGKLKVKAPKGWSAQLVSKAEIAPGERKELKLSLVSPNNTNWTATAVEINGNFSAAEKPVLSFRLIPE